MGSGPDGGRRRVLVPFEVGTFLRAPYGWTNRMRRAEGYPARGETRPVRIGLWANVLLGLALYGPVLVGTYVGWRASGSVWGAGLGAAIGLLSVMALGLLAIPVVALATWLRSR